MEALINAIPQLGFPIVCVIVLAWFIYTAWNKLEDKNTKQMENMATRCQAREDKLYEQIDKFNTTMNNFNETLIKIDTRLETVEHYVEQKQQ